METMTSKQKPNISHRIHDWILERVQRPNAMWLLFTVSCLESFIFPIPPDILLVPMVLALPHKAFRIALVTTVASLIGGVIGYYIGSVFFNLIGERLLEFYGFQGAFLKIQADIQKWGFWIISLKGLMPIPFKVVSLCAGMTHLKISTFIFAAVIARSSRFFLLAYAVKTFGPKFANQFRTYFVMFIVSVIVVCLLGLGVIGWLH